MLQPMKVTHEQYVNLPDKYKRVYEDLVSLFETPFKEIEEPLVYNSHWVFETSRAEEQQEHEMLDEEKTFNPKERQSFFTIEQLLTKYKEEYDTMTPETYERYIIAAGKRKSMRLAAKFLCEMIGRGFVPTENCIAYTIANLLRDIQFRNYQQVLLHNVVDDSWPGRLFSICDTLLKLQGLPIPILVFEIALDRVSMKGFNVLIKEFISELARRNYAVTPDILNCLLRSSAGLKMNAEYRSIFLKMEANSLVNEKSYEILLFHVLESRNYDVLIEIYDKFFRRFPNATIEQHTSCFARNIRVLLKRGNIEVFDRILQVFRDHNKMLCDRFVGGIMIELINNCNYDVAQSYVAQWIAEKQPVIAASYCAFVTQFLREGLFLEAKSYFKKINIYLERTNEPMPSNYYYVFESALEIYLKGLRIGKTFSQDLAFIVEGAEDNFNCEDEHFKFISQFIDPFAKKILIQFTKHSNPVHLLQLVNSILVHLSKTKRNQEAIKLFKKYKYIVEMRHLTINILLDALYLSMDFEGLVEMLAFAIKNDVKINNSEVLDFAREYADKIEANKQ